MSSWGWQANSFINNPLDTCKMLAFLRFGRGRCKFNCSIQAGATLDLDITSWGTMEMFFLAWESLCCLSALRTNAFPQKFGASGMHRWAWLDLPVRGPALGHQIKYSPLCRRRAGLSHGVGCCEGIQCPVWAMCTWKKGNVPKKPLIFTVILYSF